MPATPISWRDTEPARLAKELDAMSAVAPSMVWDGRSWAGEPPIWPFDRLEPDGLSSFVGADRFVLEILYPEGFPMVPPKFNPISPLADPFARTMHAWHLNGDGTICMFQEADHWDPWSSAADLVPKAVSWFLQFLLLSRQEIETMTQAGIASDDSLDHLLRCHD